MALDDTSIWDGVTLRSSYNSWVLEGRDRLADAAKYGDWPTVFDVLERHGDWINGTRVGGISGYTPLHQAAWHGAPTDVVLRLIDLGAWRTVRTAKGERAVDIAERRGHRHLLEPLTPVIRHQIPAGTLAAIQHHFHGVIRERVNDLVTEHQLRLPELRPLTEQQNPSCWFPVPGMYGGFRYQLQREELIVESWMRVVGGSGQRHVVTEHGARLVDEGFV